METIKLTGIKTPVAVEDILYMAGEGPYTWFYLTSGKRYLSSLGLWYYCDVLSGFVRIHRSYVVNPQHIRRIDEPTRRYPGVVELANGQRLTLAFSRWGSFLNEGSPLCRVCVVA